MKLTELAIACAFEGYFKKNYPHHILKGTYKEGYKPRAAHIAYVDFKAGIRVSESLHAMRSKTRKAIPQDIFEDEGKADKGLDAN